MWPHSLLFSSDEEASRALRHALRELEFEVESCPDIFSAVEKITSRGFDLVVSDWEEGMEAVFLLKTSRELKSNRTAFTVAIANPEAANAAREAGADLVLSRPLFPDEIKYALLTCDLFLDHMKAWLPGLGVAPAKNPGKHVEPQPRLRPQSKAPDSAPRLRAWPSPPPLRRAEPEAPVVAAESIFEDNLLYRSRVQTLFQVPEPSFSSAPVFGRRTKTRLLPGLAIAIAFVSVGYVFSEPLRGQGTTASVAKICGRVLERTQSWLHRSDESQTQARAQQTAEDDTPESARSGRAWSPVRVTEVRDPFLNVAANPATQAQPLLIEPPQPSEQPTPARATAAAAVRIPESLKAPVESATMRTVAARLAPSLLAALEPVTLSEDRSRGLLLQKVLPSYPEKAVRARLQGPVVLQAWIGRDGTIQDLKLIRGSLLLGEAAYHAVKQWRYQPYVVNGRAVEAETLVTVDFRLP